MDESDWNALTPVGGGAAQPQQSPAPASAPDQQADWGALQPVPSIEDQTRSSLPEAAETAVEQAVSGATLGLSKVAETHLLGVNPKDIASREYRYPAISRIGEIGGTIAGLLGPEELLAPVKGAQLVGRGLESLAGAGRIGRIIGAMGEGAVFGGVNQATDDWSQNKALDGQRIIASAGLGALLGGSITGAAEGVEGKFLSPLAGVSAATTDAASDASASTAAGAEPASAIAPPEAAPVVEVPQPKAIKGGTPTSFDDIAKRVEDAKYDGSAVESPRVAEIEAANQEFPMQNAINPMQMDSIRTQSGRDTYGAFKEMPGNVGETLQAYETMQKNELVGSVLKTIRDLSPGTQPALDATTAGKGVLDSLEAQADEESAQFKPIADKLNSLPYLKGDMAIDSLGHMMNAVPGIADMFRNGEIIPYNSAMRITRTTYDAAKSAWEGLKNDSVPDSLQKLWNIRGHLDEGIDWTKPQGEVGPEITKLKQALMNQMQDAASDYGIKPAFQRYAQYKGRLAQLGINPKTAAPEDVLNRVFANSKTVEAAKGILPAPAFNKILQNYLQNQVAKVSDVGVFSSNKFNSALKSKFPELQAAFSDNPQALRHIQADVTRMRMFPDRVSVNPSGTAKTLYRMFTGMKMHDMTWEGLLASIPQKVLQKLDQTLQMRSLNRALAGQAVANQANAGLQKASLQTQKAIDRRLRAVIGGLASQSRQAVR